MHFFHLLLQAADSAANSSADTWTLLGALGVFITALLGAIATLFVKLFGIVRESIKEARNGALTDAKNEITSEIRELKQEASNGFERVAAIQQQSLEIAQEMLLAVRGSSTCNYDGKERRTS